MSDQQINWLAETSLHVEQLDVFISDLCKDLLNFERVQFILRVLQAFLNVGVDRTTVLELFHEIINFLVSAHDILVMYNFE